MYEITTINDKKATEKLQPFTTPGSIKTPFQREFLF